MACHFMIFVAVVRYNHNLNYNSLPQYRIHTRMNKLVQPFLSILSHRPNGRHHIQENLKSLIKKLTISFYIPTPAPKRPVSYNKKHLLRLKGNVPMTSKSQQINQYLGAFHHCRRHRQNSPFFTLPDFATLSQGPMSEVGIDLTSE